MVYYAMELKPAITGIDWSEKDIHYLNNFSVSLSCSAKKGPIIPFII